MIEIDGVERALEHENTEWADRMADLYYSTIDVATRPNPDSDQLLDLHQKLHSLHCHGNRISHVLRLRGMSPAYENVIGQLYEIERTEIDQLYGGMDNRGNL